MAIVFTCTFSHNRSLLWCAKSVMVALQDFLLVRNLRLRNAFVTWMACCSSLEEVHEDCSLLLCWRMWGCILGVCQAWESQPWGWLTAGVSITFAFVLANKCAVLVWLVFHTQVFFILTVTVYLDTIGCVVAELLSVVLSEWNKRLFLLDRCYRLTLYKMS